MSRQRQPSVWRWWICLNILSFVCQKPVQEQKDKVSQAPDGLLLALLVTDLLVFYMFTCRVHNLPYTMLQLALVRKSSFDLRSQVWLCVLQWHCFFVLWLMDVGVTCWCKTTRLLLWLEELVLLMSDLLHDRMFWFMRARRRLIEIYIADVICATVSLSCKLPTQISQTSCRPFLITLSTMLPLNGCSHFFCLFHKISWVAAMAVTLQTRQFETKLKCFGSIDSKGQLAVYYSLLGFVCSTFGPDFV